LRSYAGALAAGIRPAVRLRSDRLWEIDAWRGIAILMMIVYHTMWNLQSLAGYDIGVRSGFWRLFQIATAGLFTILVGVSLTLSYNRAREVSPAGSLWSRYAIRGAAIFTWGMVISGVSLAVLGPERYVRFGVLHLIGLSIILAYPLLRFKWLNLGLAVVLIVAGWAIRSISPDIPFLEWLAPTPGHGVDYQPLVPMFSRVLIGVFLGNLLYSRMAPRIRSTGQSAAPAGPGAAESPELARPLEPLRGAGPRKGGPNAVKPLRWLGQNSLVLYIVHQPLLIGILFAFGVVTTTS
jgi:uncharacterized membrane protein